MTERMETAYLWLRRRLLLETVEPPIATRSEVYAQSRIARSSICQAALAVTRRVRAGEVKVNGSAVMSLHRLTPRPAWGLSGYSEEGTAEAPRFFTDPRVAGVEGGFALHGRS